MCTASESPMSWKCKRWGLLSLLLMIIGYNACFMLISGVKSPLSEVQGYHFQLIKRIDKKLSHVICSKTIGTIEISAILTSSPFLYLAQEKYDIQIWPSPLYRENEIIILNYALWTALYLHLLKKNAIFFLKTFTRKM